MMYINWKHLYETALFLFMITGKPSQSKVKVLSRNLEGNCTLVEVLFIIPLLYIEILKPNNFADLILIYIVKGI